MLSDQKTEILIVIYQNGSFDFLFPELRTSNDEQFLVLRRI